MSLQSILLSISSHKFLLILYFYVIWMDNCSGKTTSQPAEPFYTSGVSDLTLHSIQIFDYLAVELEQPQ